MRGANHRDAPDTRTASAASERRRAETPSTPEAWQSHIAEATALEQAADRDKVAAILEKGQRIAAFHAAEKSAKWFKSWPDGCKMVIGLTHQTASMYETAGLNLAGITDNILPPNLDVLYWLGRARRANKPAFDKAIKAGDIHPGMSREEAKDFCGDPVFGRRRRRDSDKSEPPPIKMWLETMRRVPDETLQWWKTESEVRLDYRGADDPELERAAKLKFYGAVVRCSSADDLALLRETLAEHEAREAPMQDTQQHWHEILEQQAARDAEVKAAMATEGVA